MDENQADAEVKKSKSEATGNQNETPVGQGLQDEVPPLENVVDDQNPTSQATTNRSLECSLETPSNIAGDGDVSTIRSEMSALVEVPTPKLETFIDAVPVIEAKTDNEKKANLSMTSSNIPIKEEVEISDDLRIVKPTNERLSFDSIFSSKTANQDGTNESPFLLSGSLEGELSFSCL